MAASESQSGLVLELAEEFLERYRRGERPALREYVDRHPELAGEIREVFPAMALMENIALADESIAGAAAAPKAPALEQFGDYRIIRQVGQGGMGVVYEAEQVSLGRHVALKVLPRKLLLDVKQKRRFAREARAAARLHHTHIVPVFGVGEQDGLPYYIMQFIQGSGLDQVLEELKRMQGAAPAATTGSERRANPSGVQVDVVARSLLTGQFQQTQEFESDEKVPFEDGVEPPPASADAPTASPISDSFTLSSSSVTLPGSVATDPRASRLTYWQSIAHIGVQVADALEYAHQQGVVHRDIKPSNLLLDTRSNVWVTDFGLAKTDDQQNLTHTGDILGTLRYMPPEAFEGKTDPRSDVYSLGLTLYELLALRPAFDGKDRNQLIKQVSSSEAPRLDRVNRAIPRDLVTIIHKSIEREPARRYSTAAEFEGDLQRFLNDEPIKARRTSVLERLLRWSRHNRGLAASFAAIGLLILAGLVGLAIATAVFHEQALVQSSLAKEKDEQRNAADGARRNLAQTLIDMHTSQGLAASERGNSAQAVLWFANAARLADFDAERERLGRLRARAWSRMTFLPVHAFSCTEQAERVQSLVFHPQGRYLLGSEIIAWENGIEHARCTIWDLERDQPLALSGGPATSAAWSPDGRRMALGHAGGEVTIARFPEGDQVQRIAFPGSVRRLVFSRNGNLLGLQGEKSVRVWDTKAGEFATAEFRHPEAVDTLVFNARGDLIATGCRDGRARVFRIDKQSVQPLFRPVFHVAWDTGVYGSQPIAPVFVNDDHDLLVCVGRTLTWCDTKTGSPVRASVVFGGDFINWQTLKVSPGGNHLAVAAGRAFDARVQILETKTGAALSPVLGYHNLVNSVVFSADGQKLLVGSGDRNIGLWSVPSGAALASPLFHPTSVHAVAFSADGRFIATGQEGGQIRVYAVPLGKLPDYRVPLGGEFSFARLSADGKYLLPSGMSNWSCRLQSTRVYETASGRPAGPPITPGGYILSADFAPDGRHVAMLAGRTFFQPARLQIVDWHTGREESRGQLPSDPRALDYRPDGKQLAIFCGGGEVLLVDIATGRKEAQWQAAPATLNASHYVNGNGALQFSPDGRSLWVWGTTSEVRVFDVSSRKLRLTLVHGNVCHGVRFSPDGRHVATASFDKTVRVWDAATGQPVAGPITNPDWAFDAVFSPDGKSLLITCRDGTARVWDWKQGRPAPPMAHRDEIHPAAFTPDGRWVVTASVDQTARVWDWRSGIPLTPPLPVPGKALSVTITPDGNHAIIGGFVKALQVIDLGDLYTGDRLSADDLVTWAELISGQRLHEGGGIANLTAAEWLERWQRFRQRNRIEVRSGS